MAAAAPQVRYRRVGAELQLLRKQSGMSAQEVATAVPGMNLMKLSRYENAAVQLKPEVVKSLLDFYKCAPGLAEVLLEGLRDTGRPGWVAGYGDLNPLHQDLIRLEETAVSCRSYEVSYIPGLLQTRRYARSIIASGSHRGASVEARVEVRINRQSVLTREDDPLKLWTVIHESALTMKAPDNIMDDQLDRLIQWSELGNITIQVMPALAPPHAGQNGPFTLLEFPHRDLDLVLLSDMISSRWVEKPTEVEAYRVAFDQIMATALGLEDSLSLIREKRDQLK
ncbi:helix-turn-helix domain-containing protein [Kitasatospora purpeofusca]|uniref:helix-turn-helix domain-containing protein n=1 Tax=Kitasatospora purpeofusca TaxID=67352 RepID=UPI002E15630F|nr:helix-turn-helix domain-containing protein [Kitasatospora purpeofusca]